MGRFVVPNQAIGQRWFHHFTVEVERHGVDALTGPSGTLWGSYLSTHWQHPESLRCTESNLEDEES